MIFKLNNKMILRLHKTESIAIKISSSHKEINRTMNPPQKKQQQQQQQTNQVAINTAVTKHTWAYALYTANICITDKILRDRWTEGEVDCRLGQVDLDGWLL